MRNLSDRFLQFFPNFGKAEKRGDFIVCVCEILYHLEKDKNEKAGIKDMYSDHDSTPTRICCSLDIFRIVLFDIKSLQD